MNLYRFARNVNTAEAILNGTPERRRRRAKNIIVGRTLARVGFWRWLWK
jgi:hypothetical protein